jgi:PQQ-like domain
LAPTTLDQVSARALAPAWFFATGDAVTANPIVVGSTLYVGSWDGHFYALDRVTGQARWKFEIAPQPAVTPRPGEFPRDPSSDGGLITSSAWFQPGAGSRPDLVIFGGGYTLYAVRATDGTEYWHHDYTGLPEAPADPAHNEARIFSSPVVVGNRVLFGVTSDGQDGHRGYFVAATSRRAIRCGDSRRASTTAALSSTTAAAACGRRRRSTPRAGSSCSTWPTATSRPAAVQRARHRAADRQRQTGLGVHTASNRAGRPVV